MSITLKVKCGTEVHRILLQEDSVTYEAVQAAIQTVHPDGTAVAKYLDDENDLCTLCPASFSDFLTTATTVSNGRRILKIEVTSGQGATNQNKEGCPMATMLENLLKTNGGNQNPLADIIKHGLEHFKGFAENGGFDELKNMFENSGMHGCHGRWHGGGGGGGHLRQVKFMLLQLRKNGLLNKKTAAALTVYSLSDVLTHVASHTDKIDWKIRGKMEHVRPVLQDLRQLVAGIPELEHCAASIEDLLSQEAAAPSVTILALLTSLDTMSFDAQIAFFEAFYASQEGRLEELFSKIEPWTSWMPTIPLHHAGVVCDGCECAINGLRFKCKIRPDFDLCGDCYTSRADLHAGSQAGREFEMKFWPDSAGPWGHMAFKGCRWGKGMGKWKGFGKGKAKCGGKRSFHEVDSEGQPDQLRKCAREGCSFAATWHATHCCNACANKGNGNHGGRCEKKCAPHEDKPVAEDAPMAVTPEQADFQFPVVVEDGRRLKIEWNRNDEPHMIAERFASEHGIPAEEIPAIIDFVGHATALHASVTDQKLKEEPKQDQPKDDAKEPERTSNDSEELEHVIKRLEEMGLGNAEMLHEFVKDSGGDVQKVIAMLTDNK